MLKVKSKIKINTARIKELNQAAITSLEETADALHDEVQQAQVVPRDKGTLQNEGFFVDKTQSKQGKVSLVNSTPYARRWYYNPESVNVSGYTIEKGKRKGKKIEPYTTFHKAVFSKSENPNAKDHWYEDWLPGGKSENFCRETFEKNYRRNGGL